jgi:DNA-directed RNA polymerase subunit alpha
LNLKGLAVKLNSRDEALISIKKSGEGEVTAADIQAGHDVEIMNSDHVIAHLTKGGNLDMEIKIEGGRGYVPASTRVLSDESRPVGVIWLMRFSARSRKSVSMLKVPVSNSVLISIN